jgi:hypothetical protein
LPQCYVYTITGDAFIFDKKEKIRLVQGKVIFKEDIIGVNESCSLTLLDQNNKFIIVNQPGKYTYKDLQKTLNVKPTGITQKFFTFIWEDLLKPNHENIPVSSKVVGGVVGGAKRGLCDPDMLEPLDNSKISKDTILFSWSRLPNANSYQVILEDSDGNEFINMIVRDTSFEILTRNLLRGEAASYSWKIVGMDRHPNDCKYSFTVVTLSEKQKNIDLLVNKIKNDNDDFLYYLKISDTLVKNGWYEEAVQYYNKAKATLSK